MAKRKKDKLRWKLGEKLTKAGRKRHRARKARKRLGKVGVKVSAETALQSGKVRKKGLVGAEVTEKGGAFAKYKKESKAAGSFREAFAANCKGKSSEHTFSWDGRSYSCARASDKKKEASPKRGGPVTEEKYDPSKHPKI